MTNINLRQIEEIQRKKLSDPSNNVISLSYESYFIEACNQMKSVEQVEYNITALYDKYVTTSKLLKDQYAALSTEASDEERSKFKHSFSTNIKNWFVKTWEFIVTIFEKLVSVVINLVKSMILYLQKKKITQQAIYNKLKGVKLQFLSINEKLNIDKMKIRVPTLGDLSGSFNHASFMTMQDCYNRLTNQGLKDFIRMNKITLNNRKSAFNTEFLLNWFKAFAARKDVELEKGNTFENEMATLESIIITNSIKAVLCGEPTGDAIRGAVKTDFIKHVLDAYEGGFLNEDPNAYPVRAVNVSDRYTDATIGNMNVRYSNALNNGTYLYSYIMNGKIKEAANLITYGAPKHTFRVVALTQFVGGFDNSFAEKCYNWYIEASKLVLDKGGYIDTITEILKTYSKYAKEDAKITKILKKYITDHMNIFTVEKDPEKMARLGINEDQVIIQNKYKRYTKLFMYVRRVKTQFVSLRQYMLGNIITIYSTMDKAIRVFFDPENIKSLDDPKSDIRVKLDEYKKDQEEKTGKVINDISEIDEYNLPPGFYTESDESFEQSAIDEAKDELSRSQEFLQLNPMIDEIVENM